MVEKEMRVAGKILQVIKFVDKIAVLTTLLLGIVPPDKVKYTGTRHD